MQRYFLLLFWFQLLMCFSLVIFADEIKTVVPPNIHEARSQYGKTITEAIKSRDFEKCKAALDSLIETFRDEDPNFYVGFMFSICASVSMKENLDNDFINLFEEQALKILQKENLDTDSLTDQWGLLLTIFRRKIERLLQESDKDKSKTELFLKQRKWHVEQLTHVWKKIEKKIDPTFDIKDHKNLFRPLYEISPAYQIDGMDPNSIADEVERKKILDYMDKRDEILRKNTNQKNAIFFLNRWKEEFVNRVVKYYAVKPYNTDEVKKILIDAKIDNSITQEIIKKLEAITK
jgi:predicted 3-demethylubiquinone-9 3-methyltransferase (glyoxalase superfamily)